MKKVMVSTIVATFIAGSALIATADTYEIAGIAESAQLGSQMTGMAVTITFDDTTSVTENWAVNGAQSGVWFGGSGALTYAADLTTYDFNWDFTAADKAVSMIEFDAFAGNTVFDITRPDDPDPTSTLGSRGGWEFELLTGNAGALGLTYAYSGEVALRNQPVVGDLYRYLTLSFDPANTAAFSFRADTDLIDPVPEPATVLLFGAGLVGLAGIGRRRKNR